MKFSSALQARSGSPHLSVQKMSVCCMLGRAEACGCGGLSLLDFLCLSGRFGCRWQACLIAHCLNSAAFEAQIYEHMQSMLLLRTEACSRSSVSRVGNKAAIITCWGMPVKVGSTRQQVVQFHMVQMAGGVGCIGVALRVGCV